MKVDNITLMMFVLNFVEFCFILALVIFMKVDNNYLMLMVVLNFAF